MKIAEACKNFVEGIDVQRKGLKLNIKDGKLRLGACNLLNSEDINATDWELSKPGEPTKADLVDTTFNKIWQAIKGWDIRRSGPEGIADATGTDVMTILNAINAKDEAPKEIPLSSKVTHFLCHAKQNQIIVMGNPNQEMINKHTRQGFCYEEDIITANKKFLAHLKAGCFYGNLDRCLYIKQVESAMNKFYGGLI